MPTSSHTTTPDRTATAVPSGCAARSRAIRGTWPTPRAAKALPRLRVSSCV